MARRSGIAWRVAAVIFAMTIGTNHVRAADRSLEYAVKSTFLYKFASFVEWPSGTFASTTAPFNLCVLGADPYGGRIDEAARGQSVGRHPVVVRRLSNVDEKSGCHAILISGSGSQDIDDALHAVAGSPVLTITDEVLGPDHGIIHFVIANDRVTFDIDPGAAARNRLVISSKLLALARSVSPASPVRTR